MAVPGEVPYSKMACCVFMASRRSPSSSPRRKPGSMLERARWWMD